MADNRDYGYFGKGATGYAHYQQTFNRCFPGSSTSHSSGAGHYRPPITQNQPQAEHKSEKTESNKKTMLPVIGIVGGFTLVVWILYWILEVMFS
jgi:hypothetical protein